MLTGGEETVDSRRLTVVVPELGLAGELSGRELSSVLSVDTLVKAVQNHFVSLRHEDPKALSLLARGGVGGPSYRLQTDEIVGELIKELGSSRRGAGAAPSRSVSSLIEVPLLEVRLKKSRQRALAAGALVSKAQKRTYYKHLREQHDALSKAFKTVSSSHKEALENLQAAQLQCAEMQEVLHCKDSELRQLKDCLRQSIALEIAAQMGPKGSGEVVKGPGSTIGAMPFASGGDRRMDQWEHYAHHLRVDRCFEDRHHEGMFFAVLHHPVFGSVVDRLSSDMERLIFSSTDDEGGATCATKHDLSSSLPVRSSSSSSSCSTGGSQAGQQSCHLDEEDQESLLVARHVGGAEGRSSLCDGGEGVRLRDSMVEAKEVGSEGHSDGLAVDVSPDRASVSEGNTTEPVVGDGGGVPGDKQIGDAEPQQADKDETLGKESCGSIVRKVTKFVDSMTTSFRNYLTKGRTSVEMLRSMSEEDFFVARQALEVHLQRYIFARIGQSLFKRLRVAEWNDTTMGGRDNRLEERLESLAQKGVMQMLGVPQILIDETPMWSDAGKALQMLPYVWEPQDKMSCLQSCVMALTNHATFRLGADQVASSLLLDLLVCTIVRERVADLWGHVCFSECFLPPEKSMSQEGFILVTFQSALSWIEVESQAEGWTRPVLKCAALSQCRGQSGSPAARGVVRCASGPAANSGAECNEEEAKIPIVPDWQSRLYSRSVSRVPSVGGAGQANRSRPWHSQPALLGRAEATQSSLQNRLADLHWGERCDVVSGRWRGDNGRRLESTLHHSLEGKEIPSRQAEESLPADVPVFILGEGECLREEATVRGVSRSTSSVPAAKKPETASSKNMQVDTRPATQWDEEYVGGRGVEESAVHGLARSASTGRSQYRRGSGGSGEASQSAMLHRSSSKHLLESPAVGLSGATSSMRREAVAGRGGPPTRDAAGAVSDVEDYTWQRPPGWEAAQRLVQFRRMSEGSASFRVADNCLGSGRRWKADGLGMSAGNLAARSSLSCSQERLHAASQPEPPRDFGIRTERLLGTRPVSIVERNGASSRLGSQEDLPPTPEGGSPVAMLFASSDDEAHGEAALGSRNKTNVEEDDDVGTGITALSRLVQSIDRHIETSGYLDSARLSLIQTTVPRLMTAAATFFSTSSEEQKAQEGPSRDLSTHSGSPHSSGVGIGVQPPQSVQDEAAGTKACCPFSSPGGASDVNFQSNVSTTTTIATTAMGPASPFPTARQHPSTTSLPAMSLDMADVEEEELSLGMSEVTNSTGGWGSRDTPREPDHLPPWQGTQHRPAGFGFRGRSSPMSEGGQDCPFRANDNHRSPAFGPSGVGGAARSSAADRLGMDGAVDSQLPWRNSSRVTFSSTDFNTIHGVGMSLGGRHNAAAPGGGSQDAPTRVDDEALAEGGAGGSGSYYEFPSILDALSLISEKYAEMSSSPSVSPPVEGWSCEDAFRQSSMPLVLQWLPERSAATEEAGNVTGLGGGGDAVDGRGVQNGPSTAKSTPHRPSDSLASMLASTVQSQAWPWFQREQSAMPTTEGAVPEMAGERCVDEVTLLSVRRQGSFIEDPAADGRVHQGWMGLHEAETVDTVFAAESERGEGGLLPSGDDEVGALDLHVVEESTLLEGRDMKNLFMAAGANRWRRGRYFEAATARSAVTSEEGRGRTPRSVSPEERGRIGEGLRMLLRGRRLVDHEYADARWDRHSRPPRPASMSPLLSFSPCSADKDGNGRSGKAEGDVGTLQGAFNPPKKSGSRSGYRGVLITSPIRYPIAGTSPMTQSPPRYPADPPYLLPCGEHEL